MNAEELATQYMMKKISEDGVNRYTSTIKEAFKDGYLEAMDQAVSAEIFANKLFAENMELKKRIKELEMLGLQSNTSGQSPHKD